LEVLTSDPSGLSSSPSLQFFPQEVAQDSRKVPFYFQYLLTEVTDPRHEQAKVMLLIESEQYASQYKNMTAVDRALEGQRIFDKFFDTRTFYTKSEFSS
jgi:hypothetical protein